MTPHAPLLRIDLQSREPIYQQISAALRRLLVHGDIPVGARLPTIRALAMDLGVHANTVAEAYRILAAEGWLELRRRNGARVIERERPPEEEGAIQRWRIRLEELIAEGLAAGLPPEKINAVLADVMAEDQQSIEERK